MKITYYGHSCFAVDTGSKILLFDPFVAGNPLAEHVDKKKIKADYILVSHGHGDHTGDLVELARQTNATVVCAWEIHNWLHTQGITKTHPMNTGGHWFFDFGKVKCVSAIHSAACLMERMRATRSASCSKPTVAISIMPVIRHCITT
jgi:L-ascorbate metabolism protein UlaG (beta-lactamase superfamily)